MAKRTRKKIQFRPDPTGSGLLSKLYITPLQRRKFLKWGLYSAVVLALLIAQDALLCHFRLFSGRMDLVPAAILLICVMEDAENGGVFALAASMFWLFSGSAPGVYCILLLTVLGIGAALLRQSFLHRTGRACVACAAAAGIAYQAAVFVIALVLTQTYLSRFGSFLITGILSALVGGMLYPALEAIRNLGGEAWKE